MIQDAARLPRAGFGLRAVIVAGLLLAAIGAFAADVPYLTGRVVDNAEILTPAARDRIAALLKAHEDKTSNQMRC
jgi:uncharacterized protein